MTCGRALQKEQGGSSPTMISEWGVTPLLQQGGSKIQGGSSPTLISDWGVTPPSPTGRLKKIQGVSSLTFFSLN